MRNKRNTRNSFIRTAQVRCEKTTWAFSEYFLADIVAVRYRTAPSLAREDTGKEMAEQKLR